MLRSLVTLLAMRARPLAVLRFFSTLVAATQLWAGLRFLATLLAQATLPWVLTHVWTIQPATATRQSELVHSQAARSAIEMLPWASELAAASRRPLMLSVSARTSQVRIQLVPAISVASTEFPWVATALGCS